MNKRNGGRVMTYDFNITFDDNLLTGNKTIDAQHKELIERIRNFVVACQIIWMSTRTSISKKRKHYRRRLVIRSGTDTMKSMRSLKKRFRSCMNIFVILKGQRSSSVSLYRRM